MKRKASTETGVLKWVDIGVHWYAFSGVLGVHIRKLDDQEEYGFSAYEHTPSLKTLHTEWDCKSIEEAKAAAQHWFTDYLNTDSRSNLDKRRRRGSTNNDKIYRFDPSPVSSFSVTLNGDVSALFPEPPPPDHVFELDSEGRVISYVKFDLPDSDYPPRWFYFSLLDQMVWKYALTHGLQLEDAIRELNHIYQQHNPINVGITIVKDE